MPVIPSDNMDDVDRQLQMIDLEEIQAKKKVLALKGEEPERRLREHSFTLKEATFLEKILDQKIIGFGG